jgi:hypothetical protein
VAAIKVIQVAAEKLPRGYDIDWAGISADEVYHKESSHLGISYLFGFCVFGFSSTIRILFCPYP